MGKILLSHICNRLVGNIKLFAYFIVCMTLFFVIGWDTDMVQYELYFVTIAVMFLVGLGALVPDLPIEMYLVPVTCKQREKYIRRMFFGKLMFAMAGSAIVFALAAGLGLITPYIALLFALDGMTMAYVGCLYNYYDVVGGQHKGENVIRVLFIGTIFLMVGMLQITSPDADTAMLRWLKIDYEHIITELYYIAVGVITVVSVVVYVFAWWKPYERIREMCSHLAEYEKCTGKGEIRHGENSI